MSSDGCSVCDVFSIETSSILVFFGIAISKCTIDGIMFHELFFSPLRQCI